jgi:GWxTD domain-containing protein
VTRFPSISTAAAWVLVACVACGGASRRPAQGTAERAEGLLAAGDTVAAVRALERGGDDRRESPDLQLLLGALYRERGTIEGRLRSQNVLERTLQLFPDDPRVVMALGRTYYAQTFFPDAERCFQAALAMDRTLCEPRYMLGCIYYDKWRRVNEYTDDLTVARRYLDAAVGCDSANADAAVKLAGALYLLGHNEQALDACDRFARLHPERGEFFLMRGAIAHDEGRLDQARADFDAGLALLDEPTRDAYLELRHALSYDERDDYDAVTPPRKGVFDRAYWLESDPDPTTKLNERYVEHMYRMFLADLQFSVPRSTTPGWESDRGETFVKFGWPLSTQSSIGLSYRDGREERWYYVIDGRFHEFLFVDENLNGDRRIPLLHDVKLSLIRYSPRRTAFFSPAVPIPGDVDVVSFRDGGMRSSVFVAMRIDADSLSSVVDVSRFDHFHLRTAVFDDDWVAERRLADTLWTGEVRTVAEARKRAFDIVRRLELPFDYYHLACAFEDELGLTIAQFRADGDTRRFTGGDLCLSDILLQRDGPSGATGIERRGRRLSPNPGHRYRPRQGLGVYFEVYGLSVRARRSDYRVTYAIYDAPDPPAPAWRRWGRSVAGLVGVGDDQPPAVTQTVVRVGRGHEEAEELSINIDALEQGRYELVVTVEDRLSGRRAEARTSFEKTAASVAAAGGH